MVHHWPFDASLKDIITNQNIISIADYGYNTGYTGDRLGISDSALYFNQGYGHFPVGNYFQKSEFTIMVWIKLASYISSQAVFDFSNGEGNDNVMLQFFEGRLSPYLCGSLCYTELTSKRLEIGEWAHVTFVFKTKDNIQKVYIYIDAIQALELQVDSIKTSVERSVNIIGKNSWKDPSINASLDDFKIYNRALTVNEITRVKNSGDS